MSNTINIDLTEDPRYHKFLGPSQYGYTVWSQQYANWYENKLITDVVVRRDVAILLEEEAEDNNVIEFKDQYRECGKTHLLIIFVNILVIHGKLRI